MGEWEVNGTPETLAIAGDDMDIPDLTAKDFNVFLIHAIKTGVAVVNMTFNDNSNSVYTRRQSVNGTDNTNVSQTKILFNLSDDFEDFIINYVASISGEEKLGIGIQCNARFAGSANPPFRGEYAFKFVPSPDAGITRIDAHNDVGGSFDEDSNISALAAN